MIKRFSIIVNANVSILSKAHLDHVMIDYSNSKFIDLNTYSNFNQVFPVFLMNLPVLRNGLCFSITSNLTEK